MAFLLLVGLNYLEIVKNFLFRLAFHCIEKEDSSVPLCGRQMVRCARTGRNIFLKFSKVNHPNLLTADSGFERISFPTQKNDTHADLIIQLCLQFSGLCLERAVAKDYGGGCRLHEIYLGPVD